MKKTVVKEYSEFADIRCRGPIYAIMFAILLFIASSIMLIVVGVRHYKCLTDANLNDKYHITASPEENIKYLECSKQNMELAGAAGTLLFISFIIIFISSLNAAYNGCFKTAITGTLLSLLVFV